MDIFTAVKYCCILHGHVFVMVIIWSAVKAIGVTRGTIEDGFKLIAFVFLLLYFT